jgi:phage gp16-like protein
MTASAKSIVDKERRRREIAAIHAMKKELALAEDSYRAAVGRVSKGRTDSAADLTERERGELLSYFRGLGAGSRKRAPKRAGRRPIAPGEQQAMIRALWLALYHLGAVEDPSERAMDRYCSRQVKVDSARFLTPWTADAVIKGLRGWCKRLGYVLPVQAQVEAVAAWRAAAKLPPAPAGFTAKVTLIRAIWTALQRRGATTQDLSEWLQAEAGVAAPHLLPDGVAADLMIERLGSWLRTIAR